MPMLDTISLLSLLPLILAQTGAEEEASGPSTIEIAAIVGGALIVVIVLIVLSRLGGGDDGGRSATGAFVKGGDPLARLRGGLHKTRNTFGAKLRALFGGRRLSDEVMADLEDVLISADIGSATTDKLIGRLREAYKAKKLENESEVLAFLKDDLRGKLDESARTAEAGAAPDPVAMLAKSQTPPTVILVAGVNGTGKTTSIAKLAYHIKKAGHSVLLAASDTFRAAAVEQLTVWSKRLEVDIVKNDAEGADPAAVAHDAIEAAKGRKVDYLIVDTAGRLHTQANLMKELGKIKRVLQKQIPDAPHEVLLVLDATTGQNGIVQAREFTEVIDITGIFLAKLDGTARGGIVVAIREELGIPVKFIGLGEQPEDIEAFDAARYVEALFSP